MLWGEGVSPVTEEFVSTHENSPDRAKEHGAMDTVTEAEDTFDTQVVVNEEQLEAITKPLSANVQVIAGPGTGMNLQRILRQTTNSARQNTHNCIPDGVSSIQRHST